MAKKIFVSGCFDLLHSGHVTFFQNAARLGDLYVAVGSDRTVLNLKGHMPINGEEERLFMVKSIGCVKDAFISSGDGILDFAEELREIRPDIFIVNEDGDHPEKRELCRSLGVEYRVLQREPRFGLVPRSSTYYRTINTIPYGLSLAGAGLELPEIYALHPAGVVITLSLEPELYPDPPDGAFFPSRQSACTIWGCRLPAAPEETLARMLFRYENPPYSEIKSGSSHAIAIVYPGINRLEYDNDYWPVKITPCRKDAAYKFLEQILWLLPVFTPGDTIQPQIARPEYMHIKALAEAADACWDAIAAQDLALLGAAMKKSFEAQRVLFEGTMPSTIETALASLPGSVAGWGFSGNRQRGMLIIASEERIEGALRFHVRRNEW